MEDGGLDPSFDKDMADRNWNRLQDVHGKNGFREGYDIGRASSIQKGFDEGYKLGIQEGLNAGLIAGRTHPVLAKLQAELASTDSISEKN